MVITQPQSSPKRCIASSSAANSDIGTVQDVAAVVERAHAVGALVHLNARRHNPAPAWVRQRQTEDA